MRNSPTVGGISCPESYHGARMDEKALEFHTQLHEWSEAQKISAQANKHAQMLTNARQKEIFLPFKKLAHIEHWTKDVNRFYRPYKGGRPKSGNFMKIDVTKYNMKVDKRPEATRSKSAVYSTAAAAHGYRIVSSVSTSTGGAKRRFFGTDIHTVNHKLIESQMHYSAQRRDARSATIRQPITSAKTIETKTDNLSVNINRLDKVDPSDSETLSTFGNTSTKQSSADTESNSHSHSQSQNENDVLQQNITVRSWSNRMLNVISIDDCKMTCRYRPQTIKENHSLAFDLENFYHPDNKQGKNKKNHVYNEAAVNLVEETNEVEDVSDIKLDVRLNGLIIGDISQVNNNNLNEADLSSVDEERDSIDTEHKDSSSDSADETLGKNKLPKSHSKKTNGKKDSISFQDTKTSKCSNGSKTGKRTDSSSSHTNKTSYGRVTSLYTHSQSTNSREKTNKKKKKKMSRTAKINTAINDMVKDRRVMHPMTRDFDTSTAEFGRTVVDKSEGSELFQKLHSNLRRKMDSFFDSHSAVKTTKYYEAKRKNSVQSQI